jgi:hypothetical protein
LRDVWVQVPPSAPVLKKKPRSFSEVFFLTGG